MYPFLLCYSYYGEKYDFEFDYVKGSVLFGNERNVKTFICPYLFNKIL